MRIYPHLQDMGGFFVAVLRRKDWHTLEAAEHVQLHANGKRAASQEPETSTPDAKRVKIDEQSSAPAKSDATSTSAGVSEEKSLPGALEDTAEVRLEDLPVGTPPAPPDTLADTSTTNGRGKNKGVGSKKGKEKDKDKDGKFKEPPYTFLEPDHPQLQQTL